MRGRPALLETVSDHQPAPRRGLSAFASGATAGTQLELQLGRYRSLQGVGLLCSAANLLSAVLQPPRRKSPVLALFLLGSECS